MSRTPITTGFEWSLRTFGAAYASGKEYRLYEGECGWDIRRGIGEAFERLSPLFEDSESAISWAVHEAAEEANRE